MLVDQDNVIRDLQITLDLANMPDIEAAFSSTRTLLKEKSSSYIGYHGGLSPILWTPPKRAIMRKEVGYVSFTHYTHHWVHGDGDLGDRAIGPRPWHKRRHRRGPQR
jgi:hypothetical protein